MTKPMTEYGRAKLIEWEGERLFVYDDANGKRVEPGQKVIGTLTAGVGHTGGLKPGMVITKEMSDRWLDEDIAEAAEIVDRAVKVTLTDYQRDALISFVFNVGPGKAGVKDGFVEVKRGGPSGLLRAINEGRFDDVPAEFAKWNKSGGKRNPGLVNRRAAEVGLWAKGEFVASRNVEAEAPKPPPAATDAGVLTSSGSVVLTGIETARQVSQAAGELNSVMAPTMGDYAAIVGPILLPIALLVLAGVWFYRVQMRRREAAA